MRGWTIGALGLAGVCLLPAQSLVYKGTLDGSRHLVAAGGSRVDCPGRGSIPSNTTFASVATNSVEIPGDFGCQAVSFDNGILRFTHPTSTLDAEFDNGVVRLASPFRQQASISGIGGHVQNTTGVHTFGVKVTLLTAASSACSPAFRSQSESTSNSNDSFNLSASIACDIASVTPTAGSVKSVQENGRTKVTEFAVTFVTRGEADLVHAVAYPNPGWRGGHYEVTITSTYKFTLQEDFLDLTNPVPEPSTKVKPTDSLLFRAVVPVQAIQTGRGVALAMFDDKGALVKMSDVEQAPTTRQEFTLGVPGVALPKGAKKLVMQALLLASRSSTAEVLKRSRTVEYPVESALDLSVSHIEVTQVIQNDANTVPLVADKPTAVRVYVRSEKVSDDAPAQPVAGVTAVLRGFGHAGELSGSPLIPFNGPITASTSPSRHNLNDSLNFMLPDSWIRAAPVRFEAEVIKPPEQAEDKTDNNKKSVEVEFRIPPGFSAPWILGYASYCVKYPFDDVRCGGKDILQADYLARKLLPIAPRNMIYAPMPFFPDALSWHNPESDSDIPRMIELASGFSLLDDVILGNPDHIIAWGPYYPIVRVTGEFPVVHEVGGEEGLAGNAASLARSLAHAMGVYATDENREDQRDDCDEDDYYPIGDPGFDTELLILIPASTKEVRTWCTANPWISAYDYTRLFNVGFLSAASRAKRLRSAEAEVSGSIVIAGQVARDGASGSLSPAYRRSAAARYPETDPDAPFCLVLSSDSAELSRFCFGVEFQRDNEAFAFRLPFPVEAKRIALMSGGNEIESRAASSAAPVIEITAPTAGEQWSGGEQRAITWSASDADGDPLTYSVLYSPNGGASWFPMRSGLTDTRIEVPTSAILGGGSVLFRVLASDGFHSAEATSGAIAIAQQPALEAGERSVDFLNAVVGSFVERRVSLRNTGTGPLSVKSLGSNNAAFTIRAPAGAFLIPAGASADVTARFAPPATGTHSATLTADVEGLPALTFALTGKGVATTAPVLAFSPSSAEFGDVRMGETKDVQIVVINDGGGPLTVTSLAIANALFTVVSPVLPVTVAAGDHRAVTLRFSPNATGVQTSNLIVGSNDATRQSVTVALRGAGVAGTGGGTPPVEPPPPAAGAPAIQTLSPARTTAGEFGFVLTVEGVNFVSGSTVRWNTVNRPTTFVSATRLTATISRADIAAAGTFQITVSNPDGTGISAAANFIVDPAPMPAPRSLIQQFDTAECPQVNAYISVLDAAGASISRLAGSTLACEEDGRSVRCTAQPVSTPLSAVLILSTQGLTEAEIEGVKQAARTFINQMTEGDRTAIVHLETEARPLALLSPDKNQLLGLVNGLRAVGTGAALYDAVNLAASTLNNEQGRRRAIILLASQENRGGNITNPATPLTTLRISRAPVLAIGFGPGVGSASLGTFLKQAVTESQGVLVAEENASNLTVSVGRLARNLHEQHVVKYSAPDSAQHTLSLSFSGSLAGVSVSRVRPACTP